jgi:hypothetical protein
MSDVNDSRNSLVVAFNKELGHRLASLDRGECLDPTTTRNQIEAKSQARRKTGG